MTKLRHCNIKLVQHRLPQFRELNVDENIVRRSFRTGCSVANCDATCCQGGVYLDSAERDTILAHADLIRQYMESHQEHDPNRWFEEEIHDDSDFPSGKAAGTRELDYGCVFLDSKGRCVLQVAAMQKGMAKFVLKPFFCVAFPLTIEHGTLMIDDPEFTDRPACCSRVENGQMTAIEVCAEELEFMLGVDGFRELRDKVAAE